MLTEVEFKKIRNHVAISFSYHGEKEIKSFCCIQSKKPFSIGTSNIPLMYMTLTRAKGLLKRIQKELDKHSPEFKASIQRMDDLYDKKYILNLSDLSVRRMYVYGKSLPESGFLHFFDKHALAKHLSNVRSSAIATAYNAEKTLQIISKLD